MVIKQLRYKIKEFSYYLYHINDTLEDIAKFYNNKICTTSDYDYLVSISNKTDIYNNNIMCYINDIQLIKIIFASNQSALFYRNKNNNMEHHNKIYERPIYAQIEKNNNEIVMWMYKRHVCYNIPLNLVPYLSNVFIQNLLSITPLKYKTGTLTYYDLIKCKKYGISILTFKYKLHRGRKILDTKDAFGNSVLHIITDISDAKYLIRNHEFKHNEFKNNDGITPADIFNYYNIDKNVPYKYTELLDYYNDIFGYNGTNIFKLIKSEKVKNDKIIRTT